MSSDHIDQGAIPTYRPENGSNSILDDALQEYINGLVNDAENRLAVSVSALSEKFDAIHAQLSITNDSLRKMIELADATIKAHQENVSLARQLGIIWSKEEQARLERERNG